MEKPNTYKFLNFSHIHSSWYDIFHDVQSQQLLKKIDQEIYQEKIAGKIIYPRSEDIFRSFRFSFHELKGVILGQDPYHGPNQAHGLAFSVPGDMKIPPSLKNIFKELVVDIGEDNVSINITRGDLSPWSRQGVMLLNSVMTVRAQEAGSHRKIGWMNWTDLLLEKISSLSDKPLFFILWGNYAKSKKSLIEKSSSNHLILSGNHPSPLSAHKGFFNQRYFSQVNDFLEQNNRSKIMW